MSKVKYVQPHVCTYDSGRYGCVEPIEKCAFCAANPTQTKEKTSDTVYITKDGLIDTAPPDKINEFDTGAIRSSDENKILWDLIPVECLERVAIKYTDGAKIYGKHNWEKGIPTERYVGGALRHFMQWRLGQKDEDHLSAVVFNIFGIMFNEIHGEKE